MTRNDTLFKILFAIEIALLPLVIAVDILISKVAVSLFIAAIVLTKVWRELFKNKDMKSHIIINSIGDIATISTLVIFFTVKGYIDSVVLCVFVVALAAIMNVLKIVLYKKTLPEMISAVDTCFMMFECLLLIALSFVMFYTLVTDIALFALLLTSAVSVLYKLYYIFVYYGVADKIKNLFRRK